MLFTWISFLPFIFRRNALLAGYTTFRNRFGLPRGCKLFKPCHGSKRIWSCQKFSRAGIMLSCFGITSFATVCHGYFSGSQTLPAYSTGWSSRFSSNWTWKRYSASWLAWKCVSHSLRIWFGCSSGLTCSSYNSFCVWLDGTRQYFTT